MESQNTPLILEYPGGNGRHQIRTITRHGKVLVSLNDLIMVLAEENTNLAKRRGETSLYKMVAAQIDGLEDDEILYLDTADNENNSGQPEVFVTEPGVFRVISQDTSPACRQFQRWLYHEVLPSIQTYGTYPPPDGGGESELLRIADQVVTIATAISREIRERERLERELHDRLSQHDQQLEDLYSKVERRSDRSSAVWTIEQRLRERQMGDLDYSCIHAYCIKFALEKNEPCRIEKEVDGSKTFYWTEAIVDQALDRVLNDEGQG